MKEIKVKFAPLVKQLEVQAKKNLITSGFTGQYRSAFKGSGLEFDGYRRYDQSDDAKLIDWKATLRSGQLMVREFVQERQLETWFVFDVSSSMCFASTEKLKCEYSAEFIAALTFAIIQGGDGAGLIMFSDRIVFQLNPAIGARQYYMITKALSNPQLYEGEFDLDKMLRWLNQFVKRNSTVVIVSDFIGLEGDWRRQLAVAGQKFELIGVMIRDPRDQYLPDVGQVVISDPFTSREMVVDTKKVKKEYEANARAQVEEFREAFKKSGGDLLILLTDKEFVNPLKEFFAWRKVKWR
ncbi:MAG: DUF58 domain-containing protein [Nanoarchaeota archaeon]